MFSIVKWEFPQFLNRCCCGFPQFLIMPLIKHPQFLSHNARLSQHYNSQIPFSGYGEDAIASYGYNKLMLFYG